MYTYLLQLFTTANQKSSRSYRSYLTFISDQQLQLQQEKRKAKQQQKREIQNKNERKKIGQKEQETEQRPI